MPDNRPWVPSGQIKAAFGGFFRLPQDTVMLTVPHDGERVYRPNLTPEDSKYGVEAFASRNAHSLIISWQGMCRRLST